MSVLDTQPLADSLDLVVALRPTDRVRHVAGTRSISDIPNVLGDTAKHSQDAIRIGTIWSEASGVTQPER
jgi:hypothetical protein